MATASLAVVVATEGLKNYIAKMSEALRRSQEREKHTLAETDRILESEQKGSESSWNWIGQDGLTGRRNLITQ